MVPVHVSLYAARVFKTRPSRTRGTFRTVETCICIISKIQRKQIRYQGGCVIYPRVSWWCPDSSSNREKNLGFALSAPTRLFPSAQVSRDKNETVFRHAHVPFRLVSSLHVGVGMENARRKTELGARIDGRSESKARTTRMSRLWAIPPPVSRGFIAVYSQRHHP